MISLRSSSADAALRVIVALVVLTVIRGAAGGLTAAGGAQRAEAGRCEVYMSTPEFAAPAILTKSDAEVCKNTTECAGIDTCRKYAWLCASAPAPAAPRSGAAARAAALHSAYPAFIDSVSNGKVYWRDGSTMTLGNASERDFGSMTLDEYERFLDNASIADMFALPYPAGAAIGKPTRNSDPGRARNMELFTKMYGRTAAQVKSRLTRVAWLPRHGGGMVRFTKVNGADKALSAVSAELDALPDEFISFCRPTTGTFSWRAVRGAKAERLSSHSFGIAIDLNTKYSDYWLWSKEKNAYFITYRNRIPEKIVDIFERHGFVWGGRWYHFDTMHFEYRPEMTANNKR